MGRACSPASLRRDNADDSPWKLLVTNTLILARSSGRPLSRHLVPVLPPDCILDCIYVESTATLFVLDVMRWKGQSIAECEAEFR